MLKHLATQPIILLFIGLLLLLFSIKIIYFYWKKQDAFSEIFTLCTQYLTLLSTEKNCIEQILVYYRSITEFLEKNEQALLKLLSTITELNEKPASTDEIFGAFNHYSLFHTESIKSVIHIQDNLEGETIPQKTFEITLPQHLQALRQSIAKKLAKYTKKIKKLRNNQATKPSLGACFMLNDISTEQLEISTVQIIPPDNTFNKIWRHSICFFKNFMVYLIFSTGSVLLFSALQAVNIFALHIPAYLFCIFGFSLLFSIAEQKKEIQQAQKNRLYSTDLQQALECKQKLQEKEKIMREKILGLCKKINKLRATVRHKVEKDTLNLAMEKQLLSHHALNEIVMPKLTPSLQNADPTSLTEQTEEDEQLIPHFQKK